MFGDKARRRAEKAALAFIETRENATVIFDRAGAVIYANAAAQKLTGIATGSPVSDMSTLFGSAASRSRFCEYLSLLQGGQGFSAEFLVEEDEDSTRLLIGGRPLDGSSFYLRFEDVTERRQMEALLQAQRAELAEMMDEAPIGFFSADQDGIVQFANATLAEWLGESVAALIDGSTELHRLLSKPPETARPIDLIADGSDTQAVELAMRRPDGEEFPAQITQRIFSAAGGGMRSRAVVRNLSDDRDWEAALRRSERRFQRFFSQAPFGIALIDEDGRITECNPALRRILRRPENEQLDVAIADLIAVDPQDGLEALFKAARSGAAPKPLDATISGVDGAIVQLFARALEETDSGEVILHVLDMTERRNLERQFAQSQKMQAVGQLAGGIAHDFNNLLTAMIGFCDLLLQRHTPGDPSFSDIMQVKHNANRASNLVRQLLAFSRQQTLQPKIIGVTDALSDLSHLLRRLIGSNIELELNHGRDLGLIKVDPNQLDQVIINLVVNARDAMTTGGKVTIATSGFSNDQAIERGDETMPPGEWVAIQVSDTGTGIPDDIKSRIFEPFFSTKEVGKGTGLGLSTVYGIVRQTGGFLFVDSTIGKGTSFTIYLPVAQADAPTAAVVETPEQGVDITGFGSVLLVEDEDAVRVFSARALENIGYQVVEADSGESALEKLEEEPGRSFDLIITDVVMPTMDGPTFVGHIRKQRPRQRVLYISGYTEDRVREEVGTEDDVTFFLSKPFSLKQLAERVKEVIRG